MTAFKGEPFRWVDFDGAIRLIGLDTYKKLVENYGENPLYIPKINFILKEIRGAEITRNLHLNMGFAKTSYKNDEI